MESSECDWSRAVLETVKGSHEYVVEGFSLAKGMGPGRYLASDAFAVAGHHWAIYLYPDGKNSDDNSGYVSLFIALASEATDVRALFELSLRDQSGKGRHKLHSHFLPAAAGRHVGPYTLKYRGSMWGYKKFFKRSLLDHSHSHFLLHDRLLIHCTVGVVTTRLHTPRQLSLPVPPSDLGRNLKDLLSSGVGCDVSFLLRDDADTDTDTDTVIRAHKQILAARSPVFRAQFFGPIGNPNLDKVRVHDVEPLIFKMMIQFIYSDELDEQELSVSKSTCSDSAVMVQHLLAAADRYGMERLRVLCEAKLCAEITAETVATTLALAERHNCSLLKADCLRFIASKDKLPVVMQTEGFSYLEETCPSLLSDLLATVAHADVEPNTDIAATSSSSRKRAFQSPSNLALLFEIMDPTDAKRIRQSKT